MDIYLWNQSPEDLEDSDGQIIAEACDRQMQEDVAPAYGLQPSPRVSFAPHTVKREDLPENRLVIIFYEPPPQAEVDTDPPRPPAAAAAAAAAGSEDLPAAAAAAAAAAVAGLQVADPTTRTWGRGGRNFARVYPGTILDSGGSVLDGARSISAATSHECIEATYDRNLAWWAWNVRARKVVAAEVCDPVEEDAYPMSVDDKEVFVSNFVYPAWFDAGAPADSRFDQMERLHASFSCSQGGYLIVYDPAHPEDDVHMEPPQDGSWGWNVKVKEEGFARTRVRLVWRGDRLVWVPDR
jgi:hypothetical protein